LVLREGHDMIPILLTGHTICIFQYWTEERGQDKTFLTWG
jgi:hypothetical protein